MAAAQQIAEILAKIASMEKQFTGLSADILVIKETTSAMGTTLNTLATSAATNGTGAAANGRPAAFNLREVINKEVTNPEFIKFIAEFFNSKAAAAFGDKSDVAKPPSYSKMVGQPIQKLVDGLNRFLEKARTGPNATKKGFSLGKELYQMVFCTQSTTKAGNPTYVGCSPLTKAFTLEYKKKMGITGADAAHDAPEFDLGDDDSSSQGSSSSQSVSTPAATATEFDF